MEKSKEEIHLNIFTWNTSLRYLHAPSWGFMRTYLRKPNINKAQTSNFLINRWIFLKTYLKKCPCLNPTKLKILWNYRKYYFLFSAWLFSTMANTYLCHKRTNVSLKNWQVLDEFVAKGGQWIEILQQQSGWKNFNVQKEKPLLGVVYGKASTRFIAKVAKKVHFKLVQKNISSIYFEFSLPLRNRVKRTFLSFEERVSIASTVIIKQCFSTFWA